MKIVILSKWFEEIDLAPFFFSHYDFADEIWIYLDRNSNDGTREWLQKQPKARIFLGESNGKLNDYQCSEDLSAITRYSDADWLIYADADEFVFPMEMQNPREVLQIANGNVLYSHMWNMYRHVSDKDLDINDKPIILQRRHGDPNRIKECIKPNIIKPQIGVHWCVGCHHILDTRLPIVPSSYRFDGAHWQSVDLELSCKRRIKNVKERLSQINYDNLWASHNFNVTREEIAALMEEHKNDPQLF